MARSLDEAAFASFHARSSRPLWSYVYRVTGNAADADDIVQDAFCRLLVADLASTDEEGWRRYLYRIASNLIVDRWRRVKRESGEEAVVEGSTPGQRFEEDADVARIFSELGERDRALLWLAYVEGESHEEMATSLGVGRRSIKVLLFRARRRLRELLVARGVAVKS
jgi:RNA polymerase sigma-70 factor (ECF subfamily)